MPAPTIEAVYLSDEATGVPVRADIEISFDIGVDLLSCRSNVVLYGADFDRTSGPDQALWIDPDTGENPYFLKSPGLRGTVPLEYSLVYLDSDDNLLDPQPTVLTQAAEAAAGYKHRLVLTPKAPLAPSTSYDLYIIGKAELGDDRGVSQRTVFDVDETSVVSTTGDLQLFGQWEGASGDNVHVKITTAGDIGVAKYKWWYETEGEGSARTGKLLSRRYRKLEDGLQLRALGSGFILDDEYVIGVEPVAYLAESYKLSFTTGTGAIASVPASASTSVLGDLTSLTSPAGRLTVLESTPEDGATHQPLTTRSISITFSENIDPTTITDETVKLWAYPVSGAFTGPSSTNTDDPFELYKKLTVSGAVLTVEF